MNAVLAQGPMTVEKRAVCWLDVLIFALFITTAMWSWSTVDHLVNEERRDLKPVKEGYEHQANVPFLQARFTMAQEELKLLDDKLFELRLEATRLRDEFKLQLPNPRARLLSQAREQQIKLLTTETLVGVYEAEVPGKIQQAATAATAIFFAKRSAELEYAKAKREFDRANKERGLAIGFACWAILALATWSVCTALHKRLGYGSALHVLLPASIVMVLASIYYVVR
jgi:hypothetical protein